jgi:hypothetical protein
MATDSGPTEFILRSKRASLIKSAIVGNSAEAFLRAWRNHPLPGLTKYPSDWQAKLLTVKARDTWLIPEYSPLFALLCWLAADPSVSPRAQV